MCARGIHQCQIILTYIRISMRIIILMNFFDGRIYTLLEKETARRLDIYFLKNILIL